MLNQEHEATVIGERIGPPDDIATFHVLERGHDPVFDLVDGPSATMTRSGTVIGDGWTELSPSRLATRNHGFEPTRTQGERPPSEPVATGSRQYRDTQSASIG